MTSQMAGYQLFSEETVQRSITLTSKGRLYRGRH